ncbi:hypothetical protein [Deinococcus sp.]|uniref:hypothetical protein n=1 Tax=Deinococcus sp. TaxID=47478 RepID=UPI003C7D4393
MRELETVAKREREFPAPIRSALAAAYRSLGMPVHAAQALKRAGEATGDVLEIAGVMGDLPVGARVADLLDFEQGRSEVMYGQMPGGRSADGVRRISALVQRLPGYLPAQNVLATAVTSRAI